MDKDMDIDSFFKMRDKKKKSKKANMINPATMLHEITQVDNKKPKKTNDKSNQNSEVLKEDKNKEDDEWEEAGEQILNISNLRINKLPVPTENEESKKQPTNQDDKSDTESENSNKKDNKSSDNPWAKGSVPLSSETEKEVTQVIEPPAVTNSGTAKYVPPSHRNQGEGKLKKLQTKSPNITDCAEFPTLGQIVVENNNDDGEGTWKKVNKTGVSNSQPAPSQISVSRVTSSISSSKLQTSSATNPNQTKYVPPHLRNRFALLNN